MLVDGAAGEQVWFHWRGAGRATEVVRALARSLSLFSASVLLNGDFGSGTGTAERRHPGAWFWTGGSGSRTGAVSVRVDSRSALCSLLISPQKHQTLQPTDDHVTPLKLLARTFCASPPPIQNVHGLNTHNALVHM